MAPSNNNSKFAKLTRGVTALKPSKPRAQSVTKQLDNAIPAEKPWDPKDYPRGGGDLKATYSSSKAPADGLLLCCRCKSETELTHYQGPFPFTVLKCRSCKLKPCKQCFTTEILTQIPSLAMEVCGQRLRNPPADEVAYARVCSRCGLSHRADRIRSSPGFEYQMCECGQSIRAEDPMYFIGSVHKYRKDPLKRAHDLEMQRLHAISEDLTRPTSQRAQAYPPASTPATERGLWPPID